MAVSAAGTRDNLQADNYARSNKYASTYSSFEGILALPLAETSSGGVPVEFVRVHQPYRVRRVEFEYAKNSTPPLIPPPQDNEKEYLLSSSMSFPLPSVNADRSTLLWQAMGNLLFVEKGAWSVASGFRIGDYSTSNTPSALNALGSVAGGLAVVALEGTDGYGETLANNLPAFDNEVYQYSSYNYNFHFPSRFMVSDLAIGN